MTTEAQAQPAIYNLTKPVILSFPNLIEPRAFGKKGKETGEPKYGGNFNFELDHPDLAGIKALAVQVAKARWPGRDFKDPAKPFKWPFSNGDKLADRRKEKSGKDDGAFQRGKIVIAARSKFEPALASIENKKLVNLEGAARAAAKGKFYSGVLVLAQFNFVAYDGVGANPDGVTAYLNMVVTTNKGERLAGGNADAAAVFGGYVGVASEENPTSGLDDEMPF